MSDEFDSFRCVGGLSSPPCMAGEVAPGYFDPLAVDPQQARDVARWRKAQRTRLRDLRKQPGTVSRRQCANAIIATLRKILNSRKYDKPDLIVSLYWPIKDEPDLRPLMIELGTSGVSVALPVVERKASPLVFRTWTPETRMVRGDWNIPVPPPDAAQVRPDVVLAPLVGWDGAGYRLGYGGGYFDRTLAAVSPRPFSIGTGLHDARLDTIFPQPHDIPLDMIVTEHGIEFEKSGHGP